MPNRFPVQPLCLSLAAALLAIAPARSSEKEDRDGGERHRHRAFQVGLWGDLPYAKIGYGGIDSPKMQALIKDMNRSDLAFSVFDGGTKDGGSLCTDANIGSEPARLFGMFEELPFQLRDAPVAPGSPGTRGPGL